MQDLRDIERRIDAIERLVVELKESVAETPPARRTPALALCQESISTIPDWP